MKNFLKNLTIILLAMIATSVFAQDKSTSLVNYTPNSNFIVIKVKNAKDLKAGLENHPLKKIIYNEKTKDLFDEMFQNIKSDEADEESKETKELKKKSIEMLFAAFNGEMILTVAYEKIEEAKFEKGDGAIGTILAQVEPAAFNEFVKSDIAIQEKAKEKKIITKKQFEGIEYYSIVGEKPSNNSFSAVASGIAVLCTNEDVFKRVLSAIVKKAPLESGLKNNEKIFTYLNTNQNKDVLFSIDMAPVFKATLAKEATGPSKLALDAMKFDKLFQINASFDLDEKVDSFDFTLNGLDDGFLQFATFINSEFTPSAFISSDVSGYSRIFFSVSELKKRIIDFATKISPEFAAQYPGILAMAKTNFQFDIEAFFDSIGEDIEAFTVYHKDGIEESLFINKLKNQSNFITNLSSALNNPIAKQALDATYSIVENKEGGNQFWVFTSKATDPNAKEISFALGSMESYAFLSSPGNMAQKHVALVKKSASVKLSSSAAFNTARAYYPAKVSMFSFAITKDLILNMKSKLIGQKATLSMINPNFEKALKILEDINPEDFKGSISYGLWKETNKLSFSVKLNNK